jgi:hypothetical protein
MNRLRNAWHALFARNPSITVEVTGGTWSAKWKHMTPDDAAMLMYGVADAVADRAFAGRPCSATVH